MAELVKMSEQEKRTGHIQITSSGGLLGIDIVILQTSISLGVADPSLFITILCFALAIPLLSTNIIVLTVMNHHGYVYKNGKSKLVRESLFVIGFVLTIVGIVTYLWHISWIASGVFIAGILVAFFVAAVALPGIEDIAHQQRADEEKQPSEKAGVPL